MYKYWKLFFGALSVLVSGFLYRDDKMLEALVVLGVGLVLLIWALIEAIANRRKAGASLAEEEAEGVSQQISKDDSENNEAPDVPYETVKVIAAQVEADNGDGESRQCILRQIDLAEPPYHIVDAQIKPTTANGRQEYGVYVNDAQIGTVPEDKVQFVADNWARFDEVSAFEVTIEGSTDTDETYKYGAEVFLRFKKA